MVVDTSNTLLTISGLTKRFGGIVAVEDLSLLLSYGELVALIGPNGSGKTTTINLMTGALKPDRGRINLDGVDMAGKRAYRFAHRGIARTFQVPRLFRRMTVLENLVVPTLSKYTAKRPMAEALAADTLHFLHLSQLRDELAGALSGGQQKLLELGRALMLQPRLLLLDEPFAGVNPNLIVQIIEHIKKLNADGYTIVVVDHNLEAISSMAKRIVVMAQGRKIADGAPSAVLQDPEVIKAYTGSNRDHKDVRREQYPNH